MEGGGASGDILFIMGEKRQNIYIIYNIAHIIIYTIISFKAWNMFSHMFIQICILVQFPVETCSHQIVPNWNFCLQPSKILLFFFLCTFDKYIFFMQFAYPHVHFFHNSYISTSFYLKYSQTRLHGICFSCSTHQLLNS